MGCCCPYTKGLFHIGHHTPWFVLKVATLANFYTAKTRDSIPKSLDLRIQLGGPGGGNETVGEELHTRCKKTKCMAIQKQNNFPQTYNNKQLAIMSANQNKDNMTSRNIMKQMAAALQQHLRDANIKDVDENSVAKKLQEHLSANVISYLQLTVLKIKPSTSLNQHKQLHANKEKIDYANSLSERVASIHD